MRTYYFAFQICEFRESNARRFGGRPLSGHGCAVWPSNGWGLSSQNKMKENTLSDNVFMVTLYFFVINKFLKLKKGPVLFLIQY